MKKHLRNKSNLKRVRGQGFLRRMSSSSGRRVLKRRRQKGRWRLVPASL